MMKPSLRIIPLGGLGEIGMNMMILECGEDAIIIDCGVMFPESTHYGVDLIIPDFSYILQIQHKIRGLLLTHGHEDHIGAVPYLLRYINPPIYGSRFTLALLASKFQEHQFKSRPRLFRVQPEQKIRLGCFGVAFLPVNHSIIESSGLVIDTPAGRIIHTGDFKLDADHQKQEVLQRFEAAGKKGALLLLSDSTNVEREGKPRSDAQIKDELFKICKGAKRRIIFSVFATNICRIEQVLEIAGQLGKRVFLSGRSIENNVALARELKFIAPQTASVIADLRQMARHRPEKTIVMCTGSQAEFRSALWRISINEHSQVSASPGDIVILSSRFIPGNEKEISHLINNLYRRGAEVFYAQVAPVHVSGHAYAEELRRMIRAVNPKFFIPVHGEYRHLVRHGQLARGVGVAQKHIYVCENGDCMEFTDGKAFRRKKVSASLVFVDGKDIRGAETFVLKDRQELSETGVIFVLLIRDQKKQSIIAGPDFFAKGVLFEKDEEILLKRAKDHLLRMMKTFPHQAYDLQKEIRIQTRLFFKKTIGKKPVVMPLVIDL